MQQNPQLTIMLAQFGRHEFSDRFLSYLQSTACQYPIVYADGDVDGFSSNLVEKYKNSLQIQLIENKQTKKFKDYFTMMVKGLSAVDTKYVMLCDNDDFIIYSSIEKLLTFLNENPDYISAGSPITEIQVDGYSTKCYGKYPSIVGSYSHYRDHEPFNCWEEQVKKTFIDFQPNFYHIFKKEVLLQIWKEILELDFSDLTIMEFYYQLRALTFGKQYSDQSICHYVRQSGTGSWESKTYNFSKELVYNNLPLDIRKAAKKISTICNKNFSSDTQILYSAILDNYAEHLNNYLPHNVLRYRWPKLYKFKIYLIKVYHKLTYIRMAIFFLKEKKVLRVYKKTKTQSYDDFVREIKKIKQILKKA